MTLTRDHRQHDSADPGATGAQGDHPRRGESVSAEQVVVVFREDDTKGEWFEAMGAYDCSGRGGLPEWGVE